MPVSTTELKDLLASLDGALNAVSALGVRWKSSRFDTYRGILADSIKWEWPPRFQTADDKKRFFTFIEGHSQATQLIGASGFWSVLDPSLLCRMLDKIVKGSALPVDADEDDPSRNVLFELSTARYLSLAGFNVQITDEKEDVLASAAGHDFAVECKRPASFKTLEKNLIKIRKQLVARRHVAQRHGVAVIAIDRIVGLSGGNGLYPSFDALRDRVLTGMEDAAKTVTQLSQAVGLDEVATLASLILTAPVIAKKEGALYAVQQVATFALNQRPETKPILDAVEALYAAGPQP